jgi:hypothetical protein
MNEEYVHCPHAFDDLSPCVARDGAKSLNDRERCAGCGWSPKGLLKKFDFDVGLPEEICMMIGKANSTVLADVFKSVVLSYVQKKEVLK